MGTEGSVLITRPAGQADGLIAALREAGWQTRHLPLLSIEPIEPLDGVMRQRILDLDRYDHLIFVSANAARIGCERIGELWPQWPVGQRYWAVGRSTAQVLARAGLAATCPESDMSSEGLLALPGLGEVRKQRCLLIRGEGGRTMIADTLRQRGAGVDDLCCYRRGMVEYDEEQLAALRGGCPDLVLVSSGEGLERLSGLLKPREHTNLAGATLLVPSVRVATVAERLGWRDVQTVENASDAAMLAAAEHWRRQRRGEARQ
jgi:uroporphyrinogen-III synthase